MSNEITKNQKKAAQAQPAAEPIKEQPAIETIEETLMFVNQSDFEQLQTIIAETHFVKFAEGFPLQNWWTKIVQKGTIKVQLPKK